jgi:glycosyltransferase involved in cell wall biosynthesis
MRATVLIPAFEEGPRIAAVLRAARAALPAADLLVVDGGSTDDTAAVAAGEGARVIGQPGRGYADALRAGYRHLLSAGVQHVVQLDADGQHPPSALPELIAALSDADWVIGSRQGTDSPGPLRRRVGNAALSLAVRAACGARIADVTSGLWALGPVALALFAERMPDDVADANVRVLAVRQGLSIRELPVHMPARSGGVSMHGGWQGVLHFHQSLQAIWSEARA